MRIDQRALAIGLALSCVAPRARAEPPARSTPPPKSAAVFWIGAVLEQDAAFVGGQDVCSKQSQLEEGFTCLRASGSQYHGTPLPAVRDQVAPGVLIATTRAKLAADYSVSSDLTIGIRAGYVLRGGGPTPDGGKPFRPVHFEARAAYWPVAGAYTGEPVAPFVFVSGGVAEIDSHIGVDVVEDTSVPPPPNQPDNPPGQRLEAYRKMGYGFVGAGGGAFLPLGPRQGPLAELALMRLFPTSGTALALSVGYVFGF